MFLFRNKDDRFDSLLKYQYVVCLNIFKYLLTSTYYCGVKFVYKIWVLIIDNEIKNCIIEKNKSHVLGGT